MSSIHNFYKSSFSETNSVLTLAKHFSESVKNIGFSVIQMVTREKMGGPKKVCTEINNKEKTLL